MKKIILCCTTMLAVWSLSAANSKDDITAAAKKLGEQANYSWKSTVVRSIPARPTEKLKKMDTPTSKPALATTPWKR